MNNNGVEVYDIRYNFCKKLLLHSMYISDHMFEKYKDILIKVTKTSTQCFTGEVWYPDTSIPEEFTWLHNKCASMYHSVTPISVEVKTHSGNNYSTDAWGQVVVSSQGIPTTRVIHTFTYIEIKQGK